MEILYLWGVVLNKIKNMDWSEILKLIGITSAGQIFLIVIVGFWGKKIIEYFFKKTVEVRKIELSKELELHKSQLKQQNREIQLGLDKSLEEYKNKLEILRLEYQIQFAELHVKRSEIIIELYGLLTDLNSAILDLTERIHLSNSSIDAEAEKRARVKRMNDTYHAFLIHYHKHKIFFSKAVVVQLNEIQQFSLTKALDFTYIGNRLKSGEMQPEIWKDFMEKSQKISEEVRTKIPSALEKLEDEFRKLLGVEIDKQE